MSTQVKGNMITQAECKTVGQILGTNMLRIRPGSNAKYVSVVLLASHIPGAPVVDEEGRFLGFISEFDILRALQEGKDLALLAAKDIMTKRQYTVLESTSIEEAARLMEAKHLLNLPVEKDGVVTKTVTRHDLLRAWLGVNIRIDL